MKATRLYLGGARRRGPRSAPALTMGGDCIACLRRGRRGPPRDPPSPRRRGRRPARGRTGSWPHSPRAGWRPGPGQRASCRRSSCGVLDGGQPWAYALGDGVATEAGPRRRPLQRLQPTPRRQRHPARGSLPAAGPHGASGPTKPPHRAMWVRFRIRRAPPDGRLRPTGPQTGAPGAGLRCYAARDLRSNAEDSHAEPVPATLQRLGLATLALLSGAAALRGCVRDED